jgi:hypothetical protein
MRRYDDTPEEFLRRHTPPTTVSAQDLLAEELPEVEWAVKGVLPEGLTILAGKPKMGKSWLALGLCVAVAAGGRALGKIPAERSGALYLGLEDNKRRLQRRLKKILAGRDAPEGLEVQWEWRRLDDGGVEQLDKWLEERPQTRIIVIDTLKKIRPREGASRSMYDIDYESLEPLVKLAADSGVAILVVHHLRKLEAGDPLDMISGSTGLTEGVDGALVLKRDRGKQDATLVIDGRDIEEPSELALRWDAEIAAWALMGDAEEYRISEERQVIIELLKRVAPDLMSPKDVSQSLNLPHGSVRVIMPEMFNEGLIARPRMGMYTTINSVNTINTTNSLNTINTSTGGPGVNDPEGAVNSSSNAKPIHKPDSQGVNAVNAVKRRGQIGPNEQLWLERQADVADGDVAF